MGQETPYFLDTNQRRKLLNNLNFCSIYDNAPLRNNMPQDNSFLYHEMTLLPIQIQIAFVITLQYQS